MNRYKYMQAQREYALQTMDELIQKHGKETKYTFKNNSLNKVNQGGYKQKYRLLNKGDILCVDTQCGDEFALKLIEGAKKSGEIKEITREQALNSANLISYLCSSNLYLVGKGEEYMNDKGERTTTNQTALLEIKTEEEYIKAFNKRLTKLDGIKTAINYKNDEHNVYAEEYYNVNTKQFEKVEDVKEYVHFDVEQEEFVKVFPESERTKLEGYKNAEPWTYKFDIDLGLSRFNTTDVDSVFTKVSKYLSVTMSRILQLESKNNNIEVDVHKVNKRVKALEETIEELQKELKKEIKKEVKKELKK